jgi:hypothetical protein
MKHAPITPAPASETLNFAWQILSGEWMPCSFTRAEWIGAAEYAVDGDLADLDHMLDLDAQERPYDPVEDDSEWREWALPAMGYVPAGGAA